MRLGKTMVRLWRKMLLFALREVIVHSADVVSAVVLAVIIEIKGLG